MPPTYSAEYTLVKKCAVFLLASFVAAGCEMFTSPADPTDPPNPTIMNYTAVGASDAIGYGGSSPCIPFSPCPSGTGYVQLIGRRAQSDGKTVTLLNLGIPGAVLSPEIQGIGNSVGLDVFSNALDQELPFVARDSTVVTIFLGANDINTIGRAVLGGKAGSDVDGYVQGRATSFGQEYKRLIAGIKDRAPQARIVALNLPNMAALPYGNPYSFNERRVLQSIAVKFSAQVNATAAEGVKVIDLMCNTAFYDSGMYSSDGFHPNDTGYARIADVVYPVVANGSANAPSASCSQMSVF